MSEKMGTLALVITMLSLSTSPHPFVLILCYGIHELGHLLFATLLGAKMRKFRVGAFHLSLSYDCSQIGYGRELLICLGGIIFNALATIIVLPFINIIPNVDFFITCNLSLALMNLYPVSILDGGGALKSLLMLIVSEDKAEKISRGVSVFAIFLMWLVSIYLQLVFSSNVSLLFISILLLVELCLTL
ncbi:MAG: M50 family metallopeptidase [Clostridia bacterium]|nr:M50 family metallopeptidase [Clostridia bacterium]